MVQEQGLLKKTYRESPSSLSTDIINRLYPLGRAISVAVISVFVRSLFKLNFAACKYRVTIVINVMDYAHTYNSDDNKRCFTNQLSI